MNLAEQIITKLDSYSEPLSIEQLLNELQIAVERISFISATQKISTMNTDDIELLFEGQLSSEILGFVEWLQSNKLLAVLSNETGYRFFNHCLKRYHGIQQIHFLTAIALDEQTKQYITRALMPEYPAGARIVFEVDPAITAGFLLDDSSKVVDKTMRTAASKLTRRHLQESYNG